MPINFFFKLRSIHSVSLEVQCAWHLHPFPISTVNCLFSHHNSTVVLLIGTQKKETYDYVFHYNQLHLDLQYLKMYYVVRIKLHVPVCMWSRFSVYFMVICSQLRITRTPDNSNLFRFPLKVRVVGSRLKIFLRVNSLVADFLFLNARCLL